MPQKSLEEIFNSDSTSNNSPNQSQRSLEDIFGSAISNQNQLPNSPAQNITLEQPKKEIPNTIQNDINIGVVKGIGSAAKNLSSLGEKYIFEPIARNIYNAVTGENNPKQTVSSAEGTQSMIENSMNVPQGSLLERKNIGQKIGFGAEQIGEFLVPAGKLAVAEKAIKSAKILEGGGMAGRGLRFLASKVPESVVGAIQGTIQEGGNINSENLAKGAATNLALNSALPFVAKGVGSLAKKVKNIISPDVEAALTKAIKPRSNNAKFGESLKTALPDIQETAQNLGLKVENIDQLEEVVKETKKGLWEQFKSLLGPNAKAEIDGNIIADRMINGIDRRFITQNPERYRKIVETANTYRRPIPLDEAEEFLQSSNSELHSYYGKNKVQQAVAMGDPEISHVVRESDALREELNKKLSELTGENAGAIKKRYGALSNLQAEIVPRKNVIARQNPVSLAEQVSYGRAAGNVLRSTANLQLGDAAAGAADLATTRFLKLKNDPNELIKSAFLKLAKNPKTPYAKVMSKFVPAGYLPEPSFIPMKGESPGYSGIVKDAPKPLILPNNTNKKIIEGKIIKNTPNQSINTTKFKKDNVINENNPLIKKYISATKDGVVTVEGTPVSIHKNLETFVHKDVNGNWVVSEVNTGKSLNEGGYRLKKDAIEDARLAVDYYGVDNLKKIVDEFKISKSSHKKI